MSREITTIADIIRTHGKDMAGTTSLVEGQRTRTWGELLDRSVRVANALREAGVSAQDRVAFLDKNSIEHFEIFYGCSLINAVSGSKSACADIFLLLARMVTWTLSDIYPLVSVPVRSSSG